MRRLLIIHTFTSKGDTQYPVSNALKLVVCLGWQPGSDVFILGEMLQFHSTGEIISPAEQHVFIRLILEKLGMANTICPINTLPDISIEHQATECSCCHCQFADKEQEDQCDSH